jgi:NitT/TauT family transport system substrate-binding protein
LTLAGTVGLLGLQTRPATAEPPPETTKLRLAGTTLCYAPQFVAEELLQSEGFTDLQYVKTGQGTARALASGEAEISITPIFACIPRLDAGAPIVLLSGTHVGCYELFGTERVRTIRDLRGKTVGVPSLGGGNYLFLASMLAYVGLDPQKEVNWAVHPSAEAMQRLAEGKIDALMAFPPEPQELRAKQIGHVVVNTARDRPWSQYFCCMVAAHREFVRTHPVATKRALRAILKATDVCALEPEWAARFMVEKGYGERYDYALETIKDVPYNQWREYDPEDTVRFYALRLHEVGMLKSTPQKLLAQGTDWRFFNELKKELKR